MEVSNLNLRFKISSDNEKKIDIHINDESWMLDKETEGAFINN